MGKKWKVIENHPNYEVSIIAQVRNIRTGKLLTPYDDHSGYLRVKLDGDADYIYWWQPLMFQMMTRKQRRL